HPERNVVTRAIGVNAPEPDVWILPVGGRERFLICSDGLTKELDDATIFDVLVSTPLDDSAADRLVSAALAAGGADNVTVIVIDATVEFDVPASSLAHLEETLPRG